MAPNVKLMQKTSSRVLLHLASAPDCNKTVSMCRKVGEIVVPTHIGDR